ncbi:MAG: hypothetical protein K0B37_10920 [Bacteroidales bacterium]|nr:hypothetical protein [Bacteroidales bacterium]
MTANEVIAAFEQQHAQLFEKGLFITGIYQDADDNQSKDGLSIGIAHSLEPDDEIKPECCHMSVMHPFIFDNRKIPESFIGVRVMNIVQADTIPPEIEEIVYDPAGFEDWHTPGQYERYVRENMIEIRSALKQPDLTYEEALDAICFGDFAKYKQEHEERRLKRLLS